MALSYSTHPHRLTSHAPFLARYDRRSHLPYVTRQCLTAYRSTHESSSCHHVSSCVVQSCSPCCQSARRLAFTMAQLKVSTTARQTRWMMTRSARDVLVYRSLWVL